jgi:hypothetical protein
MLTFWREMDLFLVDTGYAKYLNGAGNKEVSRFFCACLGNRNKLINQVINI